MVLQAVTNIEFATQKFSVVISFCHRASISNHLPKLHVHVYPTLTNYNRVLELHERRLGVADSSPHILHVVSFIHKATRRLYFALL